MFSDSGTQQSGIPGSSGIFLLEPYCQCHKNKWGSVIPCGPDGKMGWLSCLCRDAQRENAHATFVNSPSGVWMLIILALSHVFINWLPFGKTARSPHIRQSEAPLPNARPERKPTATVWQRGCSTVFAHICCCNHSWCQHVKMSSLLPGPCTHRTSAHPFTLLKYQKDDFIISIYSQVFPEATDGRVSYNCAASASWDRSQPAGEGRQVEIWDQHPTDPSLPRSWRIALLWLGGCFVGAAFPPNAMAGSRCAKSQNHNVLSWKWISQAELRESVELLTFHNTIHLMKSN